MIRGILFNVPTLLVISIFSLIWIFLFAFRKYYLHKNLRMPFTQNLNRAPGQSLLKNLDHLNHEIMIYASYVFIVPIVSYATYISDLYINKKTPSLFSSAIIGAIVLVFIGYSFYRLTGFLHQRRLVRLGYDGEVTVGQQLNQLLRDGYYVYHDFPAEKFNIDHIVVGNKGVFAIETKTRSKPNGLRKEGATVEYNGKTLKFPKWTDTETLAQVKRQSSWLSKWLESATGEPVFVRGIVALPGWYVKRTSPNGIPVVNPKQFPSLFTRIQPRELSEKTITRIIHQLEKKCRDVEPASKITEQE